ncbi:hypothetical protein LTR56_011769 [Elasticomyces elasticus]|nr:hypothetical protein LTR56_011769 [Elasticomyces elasticus]KAK3663303.1 hypothetical protein LTR22_005961 [Elasticomyces elasticus]KAK4929041.1 hypothetical protein LTR49_004238 [Elasticomyces elasticus]KAK5750357.1 hypothetical protein LTS12_019543 [Elasticomyces elasticus]
MAYSNTRYTNQYGSAPPPGHSRPRNNMAPPPRPQQRGVSRGNTWTREGAAGVTHGRYPAHAQHAYEQNQDNGVGRANFQQQGGGRIVRTAEANAQNGPAFEYVFNPESDYADVYENPALRDAAAANIGPPVNVWNPQAQPFVYQPAEVQKPAESSLADFEAIVRKASKQVADGTAPNYYPDVIQLPKPDPTAQAISSAAKGDWSNVSQQLKVYNEQQPMQQIPVPVSQPIVEQQQVSAAVALPAVPAVPGDPQPISLYFPPPRQADVLSELYGPMLAIWLKQESIQHWDEVDRIRIGFTPSLVPQTVDQVVAAMQVCVDRVVEEARIRRELEDRRRELEDREILRVLTETLSKEYELEAEAQEKLRAELDECKAEGTDGALETESDEKEGGKEIVEEKEAVEVKAVQQDVHEKAADENGLDGESVVVTDEGVEEELFGIEVEEADVGELEMGANVTAEAPAVPQVDTAQMMAPEKPLSKKQIAEREQAAFQQDANRLARQPTIPASTVSPSPTVSLAEMLEKRKSMDEANTSFKKRKVEAPPNASRPRPARKPASPLFANGSNHWSRVAQAKKNAGQISSAFAGIVTSAVNQHSLGFVDPAQEANDEFAEMTADIAAARDAEAKRKMEAEQALGPVETPEAAAQRTHARCGLALPPMKCAPKTNTVRSDETTMWRDVVQEVGESIVSSPAQYTGDSGSSGTEKSQQSTPPSSPAGDSDGQLSKPSGGSTTTQHDGNGKSGVTKKKMSLDQYTKSRKPAASPTVPYPAAAHAGSSMLTTVPATIEKRKRGDDDESKSDEDAKKPKLEKKDVDVPPPQVFATNERLGKGKVARAAGAARAQAEQAEQARQAEKRKRDDGGEDGRVKKSKKTKTADSTVSDTSRVPYLGIAAAAARKKDDTKATVAGKRKHDGEDESDEPVKKTKLEEHHAFFSAPSNEAPALNEDGLAPQNEEDGSIDEVFTAANEDENEHVEKDGGEDEAGDASKTEETGDVEENDEVEVNDEVDENFGHDNEGHVVLMPFDVEKDLTGLLQYNNAKPEEDDDDDDEPFTEAPPSPPRRPAHETVVSAAAKRQFAGNPALAKLARQKARLNRQ